MTKRLLPLLVVFLAVSLSTGDEIVLTDGRVIDGEIISPVESDVVNIRVSLGGLVAVQHFQRSQIKSVRYGVSQRLQEEEGFLKRFELLCTNTTTSADEYWQLSIDADKHGVTSVAKDAAQKTIELNRHHEGARQYLGMVRYKGVWMRPHEVAAAKGEVFFRGNWVSRQEQDEILAAEAQRREELAVARRERDEQRRRARAAAAAYARPAYPDTYYSSGFYRSPYCNPHGGWRYPVLGAGNYVVNGGYYPPSHGHHGWHLNASGGGSNYRWSIQW